MMLRLFDTLTGHRRLVLTENDRAILTRKGRIVALLGAGEHRIKRDDVVELYNLTSASFTSANLETLLRDAPDLVAEHLVEVRTGATEVALVMRDERLLTAIGPDGRRHLWADMGPFDVTRHDVAADVLVPKDVAKRLARARLTTLVTAFDIPEGHVGVMTLDGTDPTVLTAGAHTFWNVGPKVAVKVVDTRLRSHDVTGHEILTRDRVTLRVNLAADFRVVDPVKAVTKVRDFEEALHRALGLAFRRTLGALTLDALLADKVAVDEGAANAVRAEMAALGVEVGAIALKDVILPGEMRDILTAVVAAEKEAEANVIRRREETNATRSLLNTAKVMAENPVMLRLKELEALEVIAGKVERLTVHNGTAGLLADVAKLRD
ncbi:slipin family protein [Cognatiyoonia sp. IB215446]|uniref:slipin family protein n=1 Tax=Cognatiyoonia sp. IB215446 TaxID=3097355 RepID=UPI002A114957|nr:slipin family protein [Cognatiyoonia sp. IB215446]MDX8347983.1 slipin family protein [Cognatiyoonia sp. IB215446]